MAHDIDREVADLRKLTVEQLRARHQQVSGTTVRSPHKEHLVRRIAWWLQALAEGGLSDRARRRATELVADIDLPESQPQPLGKLLNRGEFPFTPNVLVKRPAEGRSGGASLLAERT